MSSLSWGEVVRQQRFARTPRDHRREIILMVCAKHEITLNVLLGPSRVHKVVKARHEAVSQVHQEHPKMGTSALGRLFRRNHATIQYTLGVLGFRPRKARSKGGRNAKCS